jgi:hypothetical protein
MLGFPETCEGFLTQIGGRPSVDPAVVATASNHSFFLQIFLALAIAVVGVALVIKYRDWIIPRLNTRSRRFFWEVVVVAALAAALVVTVEAVDWKAVLAGTHSDTDALILWVMSVACGLEVTAQAVTVAHADYAETIRKNQQELWVGEKLALQSELTDAREERDFFLTVNAAFLKVVSLKRERLLKTLSPERVRALKPDVQCQALISACWELVDKMVNEGRDLGPRHRVRVAYFRVVGKRLTVAYCWDGTSGDCVTRRIENDPKIRVRFDLDSEESCLAVAAAKTGQAFWVPDSAAVAKKTTHPFVFFDEATERQELKSIVALPIKVAGDASPHDVITVDTDREGYFTKSDASREVRLGIVLKNLAHRLQLEKALEDSSNAENGHG